MQQKNGDMKNRIISHINAFNSTWPQWGQALASVFISSLQAGHCLVIIRLSYHKTGSNHANW